MVVILDNMLGLMCLRVDRTNVFVSLSKSDQQHSIEAVICECVSVCVWMSEFMFTQSL